MTSEPILAQNDIIDSLNFAHQFVFLNLNNHKMLKRAFRWKIILLSFLSKVFDRCKNELLQICTSYDLPFPKYDNLDFLLERLFPLKKFRKSCQPQKKISKTYCIFLLLINCFWQHCCHDKVKGQK